MAGRGNDLAKQRTCAGLLQELRHRLGDVSQEQLARRVGVSWSTINRWENGKGIPSPLAREKLVALLKEVGLEGRIDELAVSG
jgi:DNA-binding transcriptional regulator YiaG